MTPKPDKLPIDEIARFLRRFVFPIVGLRDGRQIEFGTGVLIGGAVKGFAWGVTATHVITDGAIPKLRRRQAAATALREFLPDSWDSATPYLREHAIRAELMLGGTVHSCPIDGLIHYNHDLLLFLVELPPGIEGKELFVGGINSDPIPLRRHVFTAGHAWVKGPDGTDKFAFIVGRGAARVRGNVDRSGALKYDLTAPSVHGMSGGAVLYADEVGNKFVPGVAAIISGGPKDDPRKTTAVSLFTLYGYRWTPRVSMADSFLDLLGTGQVRDYGEDQHQIEVIPAEHGIRLRRRSRLLAPRKLVVPRTRLLVPKKRSTR
jgi:hypothetical protein